MSIVCDYSCVVGVGGGGSPSVARTGGWEFCDQPGGGRTLNVSP